MSASHGGDVDMRDVMGRVHLEIKHGVSEPEA